MPDFRERRQRGVDRFADHAVKAHAGDITAVFFHGVQQVAIQRREVGGFAVGADFSLDRGKHLRGQVLGHFMHIGRVIHALQVHESRLGLTQEVRGFGAIRQTAASQRRRRGVVLIEQAATGARHRLIAGQAITRAAAVLAQVVTRAVLPCARSSQRRR